MHRMDNTVCRSSRVSVLLFVKRAFALALVASIVQGSGRAAPSVFVYGLGANSCGVWIEKRRQNDHFSMAQWMLGYISAAGYFGPDLREGDSAAFVAYMDNYCQANPLHQFAEGVRRLINELSIPRSPR